MPAHLSHRRHGGKPGDRPGRGHPVGLAQGPAPFPGTHLGAPGRHGAADLRNDRPSPAGADEHRPQPDYVAPGCIVVHDLRDALEAAGEAAEVFILGGGEVYREALPVASRLYLTVVRGEVEGDVRFPEVPVGEFREVERREIDDTFPCTFVVFERHAPHA